MGTTHHSLPLPPRSTETLFRSSRVEPAKIRVVIPVHKDWKGLKITLDSLQELNPRPGNITIVNDNTDNSTPEWLASYPVEVVDYEGNRGPAYARNQGCAHPDVKFDWLYFTDCGCRHAENLIMHFIDARQKREDSVIAICGSVIGKGSGVINRYMTEMDILNPPFENELGAYGEKIPQAIITSNALVYAPAFYQLGGFSTDFCEAGGEDLDLGIRLRELGTLVYVPAAIVSHEFEEDIQDFKRRFERYGRGNRFLEQKHKLPSLKAQPFPIANVEFRELAKLQTESLRKGYDEIKENTSKIDVSYLDNIDESPNSQSQIAKDVESAKWHLPEGTKLRLGKGKINDVKYSPDGNQRAVASSLGVWIYDTHTGEELTFLTGHTGSVLSIAYSPDSLTLASGSEDKTIRFWDTHTGTHKFTLRKHKESITALAFSPDGNTLISGSADGTVHVWDAHTGNRKSTLLENIESITALAFSRDGSMFVTASKVRTNEFGNRSEDGTIHFWEAEIRFGRNQCLATFTSQENVTALAFNSDGSLFVVAKGSRTVELLNGVSVQSIGESQSTLSVKKSGVRSFAFSPDSCTLAGGSKDGSIYLWDTGTRQHFATLKGHSSDVSSVSFSSDGATLISESEDGTIRLWDTNTGQSETIFTEHLARVNSIKFSPNGQTLMSWTSVLNDNSEDSDRSSDNDTLHLWNVGSGIRKATFTAYSYHISTAEFSPDSRTLVIWSKTGALELWDVETCLPKITFTEKVENVMSVIFDPNSPTLIGISSSKPLHYDEYPEDIIMRLWDTETGKCKVTLAGDGMGTVKSVHLSPDKHTIISVSKDETNGYSSNQYDTIQLWDVETGKRKVIPTEDGKPKVKPIFLSSDNRTLVSVSKYKSTDKRGYSKENGIIHLWDVETINHKTSFTDEKLGNVKSVLLSSDNRTLISVSEDKTDRYTSNGSDIIRLWDVETSTLKATLTEGQSNVESVLLSSDNRTLTTLTCAWGGKHTIHLWDAESGKSKATLAGDGRIKSIFFGSDNLTLISVSISEPKNSYVSYRRDSDENSDNIIRLWNVETGTCKATFTEDIGKVTSVDLSPDGSTLILNQIYLWDVETGERKIDPIGDITDIALSSDGNIIASGNDVGTILLWKISK